MRCLECAQRPHCIQFRKCLQYLLCLQCLSRPHSVSGVVQAAATEIDNPTCPHPVFQESGEDHGSIPAVPTTRFPRRLHCRTCLTCLGGSGVPRVASVSRMSRVTGVSRVSPQCLAKVKCRCGHCNVSKVSALSEVFRVSRVVRVPSLTRVSSVSRVSAMFRVSQRAHSGRNANPPTHLQKPIIPRRAAEGQGSRPAAATRDLWRALECLKCLGRLE